MRFILAATTALMLSTAHAEEVAFPPDVIKTQAFRNVEFMVLAYVANDTCKFGLNPRAVAEYAEQQADEVNLTLEQERVIWDFNGKLAVDALASAGQRYCKNLWDTLEAAFGEKLLKMKK